MMAVAAPLLCAIEIADADPDVGGQRERRLKRGRRVLSCADGFRAGEDGLGLGEKRLGFREDPIGCP
jgi:hypothetical protein